MQLLYVPLMLVLAGLLMSFAWIGHLKFKEWSFWTALAVSWSLVLPEYILNVFATRSGHATFTGAQMAAIHLGSGVLCAALISRYYLGEAVSSQQVVGFLLMGVAIVLILVKL